MHRFLVSPEAITEGAVILAPRESHHAATVLRLKAGDRIVVFDGRGQEYLVEVTEVDPRRMAGRVIEIRAGSALDLRLTLVQGLPKGAKMETIVRMGSELGIATFLPVLTARAVGRPSAERVARWRRIAASAAKQSGRATVPQVAEPRLLAEVWAALHDGLILIPWEGAETPLGAVLSARRTTRSIAIVIGPEGGFTPEEIQEAAAHRAHAVSLGPLVLRTESAGLVAAAMVCYELTLRP